MAENMRRWQRQPSVKLGRWWRRKTGWHRAGMPGKRRQEILDDLALRFAYQEAVDYHRQHDDPPASPS